MNRSTTTPPGINKHSLTTATCRSKINNLMDADYADDIVLFANTSTQAESLLHNQEQAAGGIGLYVNVDKTEYILMHKDIFPL